MVDSEVRSAALTENENDYAAPHFRGAPSASVYKNHLYLLVIADHN